MIFAGKDKAFIRIFTELKLSLTSDANGYGQHKVMRDFPRKGRKTF